MTVSLGPTGEIRLSGAATREDAEPLLSMLLEYPLAQVDWRTCTSCHTAVLQVLMASARSVIGPPDSDFLGRWIVLNP